MVGLYPLPHFKTISSSSPDRFSHDRGDCFSQKTVDTTKVFRMNRGLLFDPSAASLLGFLMGVEGTGQDDEWRIITLNFKSLLTRRCEEVVSLH